MTIKLQTRYVKNNHLRRFLFVAALPAVLMVNLEIQLIRFLAICLLFPIDFVKTQIKHVFKPMIKFWNAPDKEEESE